MQCRKSWWKDKNCMQMLSALPRKYNIERALLEGLIKYGENNYANAFQMVWCVSYKRSVDILNGLYLIFI